MKEGDFGRTSLHVLAFNWKGDNSEWDLALDKLLDAKNIRVDSGDQSGVTPIFLAAKKGWRYMVERLIYKGARLDTKVGSSTVTDVINKKMPDLLASIDTSKIEEIKPCYDDELYEALKSQDLSRLKEIMKEINLKDKLSKKKYLEQDHGNYTLLSYACDNGLHEFVDVLLEEEADPIKVDKTTMFTPLLYATKNGYAKIVKLLTDEMQNTGTLGIGLNACDLKGETPLHKVVKRELPQNRKGVDFLKCLEILLGFQKHLKINAQDKNSSTPLHYAVLCDDQSFVLRLFKSGAHLNVKNKFGTLAISRIQPAILEEMLNDCVEGRNRMTDADFEIILHYSLFVPTTPDYAQETDCLKFLSGSRPHRHLLRHPVIDTFLFLKWQRISRYYYANLIAYIVFLILLTTYIWVFYGTIQQNLLSPNSTGELLENLVPLSVNETLFEDKMTVKVILQVFIMIFWILGVLREVIQFLVSWRNYIKSLENWLEISILFLTIITIFIPVPYSSQQGISAWLILFSWAEFVLILGRLPTLAVYITMFTTVTLNFLKFILMFSSIIFAFTLSFFLVFQIDENFATYPKTLLKTLAMSTGEIEYTDLPLTTFPVSSHLLFVIFVFIIVLVLMNLLNGLAVSDIQQIQQEAEILSYRSRIELIAYIESVFLPNSYENKATCEQLCEGDTCCFRTDNTNPSKPPLGFLKYFGKRSLMFRKCLKKENPYIQMYPNKSSNRWSVCSCHSFRLQESQIEAAKSVVMAGKGGVAERLAGLEDRVESVMKAIQSLTDMIESKEIKVIPAK